MLKDNIIEPSTSEFNSPVLLVPKKSSSGEKKWRLVIDFRKINSKLIGDKFPLPRIDDILDQLGRSKWFSVIDLISGFHQISLEEESRNITSFSTDSGSYRFTRLPFGLSISPNSFSRMMSIAFSGITPDRAFLYMDDLIVLGCSVNHHLENLKKVFQTCRKYNPKLNPETCQFFRKYVTYLGHKITDNGILPDESKYDVIYKYPVPDSPEAVKRKKAIFIWTKECQDSFEKLTQTLISPQILQYPDFTKTFIVTTDASKVACGAVLSQNFNGQDLPISYASRSFTKGEANKSTIEKELTAIHWAVNHFRPYLWNQSFLIRSDHRPLVYLFSMKDPSSKLTRMRLSLEEFNFTVEYIKGNKNTGADALSRIDIDKLKQIQQHVAQVNVTTRSMTEKQQPKVERREELLAPVPALRVYESLTNNEVIKLPILKFDIKSELPRIMNSLANNYGFNKVKLFLNDDIFSKCTINEFKKMGQEILKYVTIVLCKVPKLITDNNEKQLLLKMFHDDALIGGHCGQKRLLKKLKSEYVWKHMSRDVTNYAKHCSKCQINKVKTRHCEPMIITPTPQC
ncbi:Integrase zinc binding domain [Popillia japonica]|uniref:RNA-directed DNA polymerase n=1 Tax=Popillia japonica TaxID=7064 RepID=A0AAW1KPU0_POPJA